LLFLIVGYQGFGVLERIWLKTWGEAYDTHNSTRNHHKHTLSAAHYLSHPHELDEMQHVFGAQIHPSIYYGNLSRLDVGSVYAQSTSGWRLPSANSDPYFYVCVYAGIVFAAAVMATVNSTVQVSEQIPIWKTSSLIIPDITVVYSIAPRFEAPIQ
jgi:hypothetical protein